MKKTNSITKNNYIWFALAFWVLYLVYSVFLNDNYTSDYMPRAAVEGIKGTEYPRIIHWSWPPAFNIKMFLGGGLFMRAVVRYVEWFWGLFGTAYKANQILYDVTILICLAISTYLMIAVFKGFFQSIKHQYVLMCIVLISFINPLFLEVFSYNSLMNCFGILLASIGMYFFAQSKYVRAALFALFAIGCYQTNIVNYLLVTAAYVFLKNRDKITWKSAKMYAAVFLTAGIPAVYDMGMMVVSSALSASSSGFCGNDLYAATAINSISVGAATVNIGKNVSLSFDIGERLYRCWRWYYFLTMDGFGYFPFGFIFRMLALICLICLIVSFRKYGVHGLIQYIVFFVLENVLSVAIYFISGYSLVARISWNIYIAIAMQILYLFYIVVNTDHDRWIGKILRIGFGVLLAVFLLLDVYATNTKAADVYISNKVDEFECDQIQAQIELYEEQSGNKVTKIAPYHMSDEEYQSPYLMLPTDLRSAYDRRILYDVWADVESLNFFVGRIYEEILIPDEIVQQYFEGKIWETFVPQEQLVFDGDTMYWAIY